MTEEFELWAVTGEGVEARFVYAAFSARSKNVSFSSWYRQKKVLFTWEVISSFREEDWGEG